MTHGTKTTYAGYDVIGDVHGCASELVDLLTALGYSLRYGVWRHPARQAVFVGDLVDHGPEIEQVLEIVAAMTEAGSAVCILGNLERDFIYHSLELPDNKSLRERTELGRNQLEATHQQLRNGSLKFWLDWCRRLPVLFEVPGLRVSHAAWNDYATEFWRDRNLSSLDLCAKLADSDSLPGQYLDWLLIGPRLFYELDGQRNSVRVRWFKTYQDLPQRRISNAVLDRHPSLPQRALTLAEQHMLWGYSANSPILITGYQKPFPSIPARMSRRNLACFDHSAVLGGYLCAYRWSGERWLSRDNFVAVRARPGRSLKLLQAAVLPKNIDKEGLSKPSRRQYTCAHGDDQGDSRMSQMNFGDAEYRGKRKQTRREKFLAEMEQVVPWDSLLALIEPFYPVAGLDRHPYPIATMLRVHLMQNWFCLSDPGMEEALYEIALMRQFARLTLTKPIPDETTI